MNSLLSVCAVLLLCSSFSKAENFQTPLPASNPSGTTASAPADNYRLVAQDVVQVRVFEEPDLETSARLSKDGTIPFPLIGNVNIGGKTIQEAGNTIRERLKEFLVNPQVTLKISAYSKRRITVLGQVARPGTYEIPDDTIIDLLEAIGMAGGYTRIANPAKITLKREVNGQEVIFKLNANSMSKDEQTKRFEIKPGDTILVGESII